MKAIFLRFGLVGMLALSGIAGIVSAQDEGPVRGAINIIVPDIFVATTGGEDTRLIAPSVLDAGETLRTDEAGVALITWFYDGTESVLGQNSQLTLNAFGGESEADYVIEAELVRGQLVSGLGSLTAMAANGAMMIATPAFTAHPLEGQFELWVDDMGETTLIVTEGRVEALVGDAEPLVVEAGQYLVGAPGAAASLSDDGVTPNIEGACVATTPTNLNVRLAPSQEGRRLGGVLAGQEFWVRAATEGNLWLQVYYQTAPEDEEGHNYGWIYGPAVDLDPETCGAILRAALAAEIYGGMGVDEPMGEAGESEPLSEEAEAETTG